MERKLNVKKQETFKPLKLHEDIEYIDLKSHYIEPNIVELVEESLAKKHRLIPIASDGNLLKVAMADPLDLVAIEDVEIITGLKVKAFLSNDLDIKKAIDIHYEKETAKEALKEFKENHHTYLDDLKEEIISEVNKAPLVKLVDSLIRQAVRLLASDIHIEPFEDKLTIRFRIDGDLQDIMTTEKSTHPAMITRIKIMANMDIVEKRIPQDGSSKLRVEGKEIDLRISTLPTIFGEKMVVRLLDKSKFIFSKEEIGFTSADLNKFNKIIKSPNGIILVTGPTGSGKSTTLYTILRELNLKNKNIVTLEDPVEYKLEGINQVNVNSKVNLTFAKGMRSILRQDPDIIMVGEIRDEETAQIAIRASITGHLVLSTMHTNDTASTIARLKDMNVEDYLLASSLIGITAQRLVKLICKDCSCEFTASENHKRILRLNTDQEVKLSHGLGCSSCNDTGYRGRAAIHEIMTVDKDTRDLINKDASIDHIKSINKKKGMVSLRENCINLVLRGVTTIEELMRVSYSLENK